MTYVHSARLQRAVYQHLMTDADLNALVGEAIYDAPLEQVVDDTPDAYVMLGDEIVRENGTKTNAGALHDFDIAVHARTQGFSLAKRIAGQICARLVDAPLDLAPGHLVALRFLRAKAERGASPVNRSITLRFRAVIDSE